jgi:hypothetical protein
MGSARMGNTMRVLVGSTFAAVCFGLPIVEQALGANALTASEICQRLQIDEKIIVLDDSGKHLIDTMTTKRGATVGRLSTGKGPKDGQKVGEFVCRSENRTGNSSSSFDGKIFFRHLWTVNADGQIAVTYEQGSGFEKRDGDVKVLGSMGADTKVIENLAPVSWVSPAHKKQRVVVQLTPYLAEAEVHRELGKFPILIKNGIVFDGSGRLWAANLTAEGEFLGVTTLVGALKLSLQPFDGGAKIGRMAGNEIRFKGTDGVSVVIKSETPMLPGALTADVYVDVDPKIKSEGIGSLHVSSGNNADEAFGNLGGR